MTPSWMKKLSWPLTPSAKGRAESKGFEGCLSFPMVGVGFRFGAAMSFPFQSAQGDPKDSPGRDLFGAQNEATDALVDHAIAQIEFYRDAGVLQVRPDGMWSRKATGKTDSEPPSSASKKFSNENLSSNLSALSACLSQN